MRKEFTARVGVVQSPRGARRASMHKSGLHVVVRPKEGEEGIYVLWHPSMGCQS